MTIYLYVKTHNKTGLKYLGKTESPDPHKYPGSGTYWKSHLKKHGKDYTTTIIKECQSKEEFTKWGLYYSNLWNVVESNEWANLKEETGDARGKLSAESRNKIAIAGRGRVPPNKGQKGAPGYWQGKTRSADDRLKISQGRTGKGTGHHRPHSVEAKEKIKAARALQMLTEDTKQKIGNSNRGKSKPLVTCPHCGKTGGISAMTRWHFANCGSDINLASNAKIAKTNHQKRLRPVVNQIHKLRKTFTKDQIKQLDSKLNLKPGWYQLADEKLELILLGYQKFICRPEMS